jgi:D-arginine dehydrogenase
MAGIAAAYYLSMRHGRSRIALIDRGQPMGLTSAASGENYRNWWPHPVMTEFTDRSIDLMEAIARDTGNRIRMTRRGYVLATRSADPRELIEQLYCGYGADAGGAIRIHDGKGTTAYAPPLSADWERAPAGVDVLLDRDLIRRSFPSFAGDIAAVLHIRRAGDISGQQLGQFMLERIREKGGFVRNGNVTGIAKSGSKGGRFTLAVERGQVIERMRADILVNTAGPYVGGIAEMLGETLPVETVLQQKIAFRDGRGAIPRAMPFAIDLDGQALDWDAEERAALAADPSRAWLTLPLPGGIHCRPDGGDAGQWIKLGWAYNRMPSAPLAEPEFDPSFPEIILRAASRLNPALKEYYGRLPRERVHYGGYYTMTKENWPLIGRMRTDGAFVVGALSGFGTMAACAAGELCAKWIAGAARPGYADKLSLARYEDEELMTELIGAGSKGVL